MSQPTFINVPVPADRVAEVYRLLSEDHPTQESGSDELTWTVEELREIANSSVESLVRVTAILDTLSAQPGVSTSLTQLAKETGYSRSELKGGLSGFTRWMNTQWGEGDPWPMDVTGGPSQTRGLTREAYYTINQTMADAWHSART